MYTPSKDTIRLRKLQAKHEEAQKTGNEMLAAQLSSDITKLCDKMDSRY